MQTLLFFPSHTSITHSPWCVGWQWSSMGATQTIIKHCNKSTTSNEEQKCVGTGKSVTTSTHSLNTCNRDEKTLKSNDLYIFSFVFSQTWKKRMLCNSRVTLALITHSRLHLIQADSAWTNGLLQPLLHISLVKTSQEFKAANANCF